MINISPRPRKSIISQKYKIVQMISIPRTTLIPPIPACLIVLFIWDLLIFGSTFPRNLTIFFPFIAPIFTQTLCLLSSQEPRTFPRAPRLYCTTTSYYRQDFRKNSINCINSCIHLLRPFGAMQLRQKINPLSAGLSYFLKLLSGVFNVCLRRCKSRDVKERFAPANRSFSART